MQRYERLRQLYRVSQVLHSTLDPQEALQLILREAVRLTRAGTASVVLLNPTTGFLEIEAASGLPAEAAQLRLRPGEGITGWVMRHGRPLRLGRVWEDPRYVMVRPETRSELAVPFEVRGEVRGVINVDSDREEAFTEEDEALLAELAVEAARVIQNTWLCEQLRHKAALFEALTSVSQAVTSVLTLEEVLQVITREACRLMGGRLCALRLVDDTREWLDLKASHGAGPAYLANPRLGVSDSLLGSVLRRRKPLQVADVQNSPHYQRVDVAQCEGLVSLLGVPLMYREEPMGTLSVYTAEAHRFSDEEIRILSSVAAISAIAIEKARLYERLLGVEDQLRRSERLSVLGLLAAEIAHEIRNPLAVMKMLYHSLDLRFPEGDPRGRDAQIMGETMDRLNRIIDRILDMARSAETEHAPVQINRLIEDLALLSRVKLRQQRIDLVLDLDPDVPRLSGDAAQIEQVLLNLTLNAVEAMPDGGTLTVRTRPLRENRAAQGPTHAAVTFRDTGVGMTREQQERLFHVPFSSTKPGGTGLGLAIVARLLEAHAAKVRIVSRPGRGTILRLLFPADRSGEPVP